MRQQEEDGVCPASPPQLSVIEGVGECGSVGLEGKDFRFLFLLKSGYSEAVVIHGAGVKAISSAMLSAILSACHCAGSMRDRIIVILAP